MKTIPTLFSNDMELGKSLPSNTELLMSFCLQSPSLGPSKVSSHKTIFNLANTILGSALLVMPVSSYYAGLLPSLIACIIMGIVNLKTASLILLHSRPDEVDLHITITRLLGHKWNLFYNSCSCFLLYMVGIIHFILICDLLYFFLSSLFPNLVIASPDASFSFSSFSVQWIAIATSVIFIKLYNLKDLTTVLAIANKGLYAVILYCLALILLGAFLFSTKTINFTLIGDPSKSIEATIFLFTDNGLTDVHTLIGIFALAFMIHPTVAGIVQKNKNPSNNQRDLAIAYIIVWFVYSLLCTVGTFGFIELYHARSSSLMMNPNSIVDVISARNESIPFALFIVMVIATLLVAIQLTTVLPVVCFFTRRQFFEVIEGKQNISDLKFFGFGLFYGVSCLVVQLMELDLSKVIGFTGAVAGFFLVYVIPILMHLKCFGALREKGEGMQSLMPEQEQSCNKHEEEMVKRVMWKDAVIFWGLGFIGFGIFVVQMWDLFMAM